MTDRQTDGTDFFRPKCIEALSHRGALQKNHKLEIMLKYWISIIENICPKFHHIHLLNGDVGIAVKLCLSNLAAKGVLASRRNFPLKHGAVSDSMLFFFAYS